MKNKLIEIIRKKWLRSIVMTIVLFAIIICAYLGIIFGVSKIKVNDLDFTKEKIYSISQFTKDKLANLDQDIVIYIYNMSPYINDFANKYANLNNHIKVEILETITSKTQWREKYGISNTDSFLVIESAEGKEKILGYGDLYTYDYTTYQEIDITEEAITNAILDVITNVKPKVYFLEGHNAYSKLNFQYLTEALTIDTNEIEYVDLQKVGNIPEDCKVLVITTLKEDITAKEKDAIISYIHKGGEILLLLNPNIEKVNKPNFQTVLDEYGVSISEGVILEGDTNQMMMDPYFVITPINNESEIVRNISMGLNACMMYPGRLTIANEEQLAEKNVTAEVLATVSNKAFYRTDLESTSDTRISSDEDAAGAPVAAMFQKQNGENNTSKMIIYASAVFATNMQLDEQYVILDAYNNRDILLNSVSYLTEREDNITIRKTAETVSTYDVSVSQTNLILGIIFAIPVFIILIGILVWQIRRRKK